MNINFIFLAIVFVITGLIGVWYFQTIPSYVELRKRLARSIPISIGLTLIIVALVWNVFANYTGFSRAFQIAPILYSFMLFEAFFLLFLRWVTSNYSAVIVSALCSGLVLFLHSNVESFWTFNPIIIASFIGATAFLVRLKIIRAWMIMALAVVFLFYDWYFVSNVYTQFTKPTADPTPVFLFPAVTIGDISLGGGDFLFLLLFSFTLLLRFGKDSTYVHIGFQGLGLLIAGYFVAQTDAIVPFMLVMTPIFFATYLFFLIRHQRLQKNEV